MSSLSYGVSSRLYGRWLLILYRHHLGLGFNFSSYFHSQYQELDKLMILWRIVLALSSQHSSFGPWNMRRRKQVLLARFKTLSTLLLVTFVFCSSIVIFRRPGSVNEKNKPFCPHHSLGTLIVNEVIGEINKGNQ